MQYVCLECEHRWTTKSENLPRQCPKCWGSAIVEQEKLKLASVSLRPWAYLLLDRVPPLPLPYEVAVFPFSLLAYGSVMSKAHYSTIARANAVRLMLIESAFSEEQIEQIIDRLAQGKI